MDKLLVPVGGCVRFGYFFVIPSFKKTAQLTHHGDAVAIKVSFAINSLPEKYGKIATSFKLGCEITQGIFLAGGKKNPARAVDDIPGKSPRIACIDNNNGHFRLNGPYH